MILSTSLSRSQRTTPSGTFSIWGWRCPRSFVAVNPPFSTTKPCSDYKMSPNTTLFWVCDGLSKSSDVITSGVLLDSMTSGCMSCLSAYIAMRAMDESDAQTNHDQYEASPTCGERYLPAMA